MTLRHKNYFTHTHTNGASMADVCIGAFQVKVFFLHIFSTQLCLQPTQSLSELKMAKSQCCLMTCWWWRSSESPGKLHEGTNLVSISSRIMKFFFLKFIPFEDIWIERTWTNIFWAMKTYSLWGTNIEHKYTSVNQRTIWWGQSRDSIGVWERKRERDTH